MDILLFILTFVVLFAWYMSSLFRRIPRNHIVCVEVSGRFAHLMTHSEDKKRIRQALDLLPDSVKFANNATVKTAEARTKEYARIEKNYSEIKTRDVWEDNWWNLFIVPAMVHFFNLHLLSWIPWARLRTIKVVKTRINPAFKDSDKLADKILYDKTGSDRDELTEFLRIDLPRVGYSPAVELANNIQIDVVWSVSKLTIFNPFDVYYHNNEISVWIDFQVNQGLVNFIGQRSLEAFQKENLTGDPSNPLNMFFKDMNPPGSKDSENNDLGNAGMHGIGVLITGEIAVVDFEVDKEQQELILAQRRQAAADANLVVAKKDAEGRAAIIELPGLAEARVIQAKGDATGVAATKLREGINGDAYTAAVLNTQALGGHVSTVVNGATSTGLMLPSAPLPPIPAAPAVATPAAAPAAASAATATTTPAPATPATPTTPTTT